MVGAVVVRPGVGGVGMVVEVVVEILVVVVSKKEML
jgi:hypothetical protein